MNLIKISFCIMVLCIAPAGYAQDYDYMRLGEELSEKLQNDTVFSVDRYCEVIRETIKDDVNRSRFVADFVLQMYFRYPSPHDIKGEVEKFMQLCTLDSLQTKVRNAYNKFYNDYSPIFPGHHAPEITMKDISGKSIKLSDLRGKMLFIDIWGTWCGPCKEEIPYIAKLYEKYKDDTRVEIISIACDKKFETWKNYLTKHPEPWAQYIVDEEGNKTLENVYFVYGIPRFMLIDKDGIIISSDSNRPSFGDSFAREFEEALSLQ